MKIDDSDEFAEFEKHCWAEIDLDALAHNFEYIRATVGSDVCAVVKADAYGHGDAAVAVELQRCGAAAFAVSCLAEGKHLRRHGITKPILILGYTQPSCAPQLAEYDIATALFSAEYARQLSAAAAAAGVRVKCHLKADTGMGRIGFGLRGGDAAFEAAIAEMAGCYALPGLEICGIFQHFAVADSTKPENIAYTEEQHALFGRAVAALQAAGLDTGTVHCANSAAQLTHPEWRCDLTRAGIILYGLDPSGEVHFPALRPVMSLKAVVTHIKTLSAGQSVSYGRTFTAAAPTMAATVCVGYADGYPRLLSGTLGGGVMALHGRPAPVIGRVCMDQTLVDITGISDVKIGDEVTVFGAQAAGIGDTADTVAKKTGTINYEITCGIARRVPRVYLKNGKPAFIWNDLEEN